MDIMTNFAETLTELMIDKQIKSEELGKTLGFNGSSIRRWCNGSGTINLKNLIKLADYFTCSMEYLIGRSIYKLSFTLYPCLPFYERFWEVLRKSGKTSYTLEKQTRFKGNYFNMWKNGALPNLPLLIELSNLLDCSIDYLVGRER